MNRDVCRQFWTMRTLLKTPKTAAAFLAFLLFPISVATYAEEVRRFAPFVYDTNTPELLRLEGEIDVRTPLTLKRALRQYPQIKALALLSPGGSAYAALAMAADIKELGLATKILAGDRCFSSCAILFFAGSERTSEGELGVHQLAAGNASSAQFAAADLVAALTEFGVPSEVMLKWLQTPHNEMYVYLPDELNRLGLVAKSASGDQKGSRLRAATAPSPTPPPRSSQNVTPAGASPDIVGDRSYKTRALLLEAAPEGQTGALPFEGEVTWTRDADEKGDPILVGNAYFKERGISAKFVLRHNSDTSLPASHLAEVSFSVPNDFAGGGIASLPGLLAKNESLVRGTAFFGASARVSENSFLYAFSAGAQDKAANLELLTRNWLDLAVIYKNGRRAIITLEIGKDAQSLFENVIAEWSGRMEASTTKSVPIDDVAQRFMQLAWAGSEAGCNNAQIAITSFDGTEFKLSNSAGILGTARLLGHSDSSIQMEVKEASLPDAIGDHLLFTPTSLQINRKGAVRTYGVCG